MTSVRCFLVLVADKGWELHQIDVHNVFLHSDLEEEFYMTLPPIFMSLQPNKVCKLQKSLFRLKQACRQWFVKMSSKLLEYALFNHKQTTLC